ncbi:MAG: vacuolar protein sorting-associated family 26 protein [Pirellulaceae bacterium]
MAACTLTITLDDPDVPRVNGEAVSGSVLVTTTEPIQCDGLVISTYWSTHGQGNIDKGDVDQCVVFIGLWEAFQEYRYPFTLRSATWPPTYYGTHLNVSHFVGARVTIPWAVDPKAQAEYTVIATAAPADLKPPAASKAGIRWVLGWIIGILLLLVFGPMFGILMLVVAPMLAIVGAGYWFFRVFLPQRLIGKVECVAEPAHLVAGQTIHGHLRFTPRQNVTINGIDWRVTCVEKCISGTGTDKTTHLHEVFREAVRVADAGFLPFGQPQAFEFSTSLPDGVPPSLKLGANELTWSGELHIDFPRWPDWIKSFPLTVAPSPRPAVGAASLTASAGSVRVSGLPPKTDFK